MVSFIVPAHKEERLISETLRALQSAAGAMNEPYEIFQPQKYLVVVPGNVLHSFLRAQPGVLLPKISVRTEIHETGNRSSGIRVLSACRSNRNAHFRKQGPSYNQIQSAPLFP